MVMDEKRVLRILKRVEELMDRIDDLNSKISILNSEKKYTNDFAIQELKQLRDSEKYKLEVNVKLYERETGKKLI